MTPSNGLVKAATIKVQERSAARSLSDELVGLIVSKLDSHSVYIAVQALSMLAGDMQALRDIIKAKEEKHE